MKKEIFVYLVYLELFVSILITGCHKENPAVLPILTTNDITIYGSTTALSGGVITDNGNSVITNRGVCFSLSENPTINDLKTDNVKDTVSFKSSLTGLSPNTKYYVRAYATNSVGTAYGNQVSFTTTSTVSDIEGNVYNTVVIGSQEWMAEDLKTTKYNDGTSIPNVTDNNSWGNLTTGAYCWFNNDASNKTLFGALYNWYAVNTNKLCPVGWHVPTDEEWLILENYLIVNGFNYDGTTYGDRNSNNKIAKSLTVSDMWSINDEGVGTVGNSDYPDIRNATGFSARPAGSRYLSNSFLSKWVYVAWWSTTVDDIHPDGAMVRELSCSSSFVYRDLFYKYMGVCVRCVHD